jgi:GTP-binding protein HflX
MEQRAILVGLDLAEKGNFERSMQELGRLAQACKIEVVGEITQRLDGVNNAHYIGKGKVQEVVAILAIRDATIAIFNDELSPSQIRNLEEFLECQIMDRTSLILEIFARRAKTREAKLQVEVAHLQYMLPRLIGLRKSLEQQSGGVGTTNRGAGEKKLELNRRQIMDRISRLREELDELAARRQVQRKQRKKNAVPVVSLVGYTNAGKSTIMNALLEIFNQPEEKRVFEKDMLFATLETSVRSIELPDNKTFLLTDTVGFISKLPHHLIKAFRSTLEEVGEADLLIHVVDSSDPFCDEQIVVTNETLKDIGIENIPMVYALNKSDLMDIKPHTARDDSVNISAKTKDGIDELINIIRKHVFDDYVSCEMLIPYNQGEVISNLNQNANILSTGYEQEGTRLVLECRQADFNRYEMYVV